MRAREVGIYGTFVLLRDVIYGLQFELSTAENEMVPITTARYGPLDILGMKLWVTREGEGRGEDAVGWVGRGEGAVGWVDDGAGGGCDRYRGWGRGDWDKGLKGEGVW